MRPGNSLFKPKTIEGRIAEKVSENGPRGIPWEAWDLLDPELQEALLERRIDPAELHELAGWLDAGEEAER
jgi:hypothetical protein